MDPYTNLAKQTIKTYLTDGEIIEPPADLPKEMLTNEAGVFVSIYKKRGTDADHRPIDNRRSNADNKTNQPINQPVLSKVEGSTNQLELRGCIGTFLPTCENVAKEIIQNAVSAATKDPRFSPVSKNEIEQLVCSIDLLSQPKPLQNLKNHNPKKHGLIVRSKDGRCGLLLPDLDGIDTTEKQFLICCQKGGINPEVDTPILYQFEVERHKKI